MDRLTSAAPSFTVWRYLAIGLLLRIPAVFLAHGYEFVDQQYQSIDPAWHLATGEDWLVTHEWQDGLRSWAFPGMLAGMFSALNAIGIEDQIVRMSALRAAFALFGLLPLAAFWFLVVRWRPVPHPRPTLLFFALCGTLAYSGVQPSAPAFAAVLSTAAVLLFLGPHRRSWFASGLCLGLAFCCRFQDAMFGPVLFIAGLLRPPRNRSLWFVSGCVGPLVFQAILDAATWGSIFHSPLAYLRFNLIEGKSSQWTTRPWWFYIAVGVVPFLLCFPPFFGAAMRMLRRARILAIPLCAAGFYLLVLSLIPRKSFRFMLPVLTILGAASAVGLHTHTLQSFSLWHRRAMWGLQIGLLLFLSVYEFNRGPVRTAAALGRMPQFSGDLILVDGERTSVGGYYYLHRQRIRIQTVKRQGLAELIRTPSDRPRFVVVLRTPLEPEHLGGKTAQLIGTYHNRPNVSRSRRRFLYRIP